jgi:hypothetical protein
VLYEGGAALLDQDIDDVAVLRFRIDESGYALVHRDFGSFGHPRNLPVPGM